jgi:hypothetical protein
MNTLSSSEKTDPIYPPGIKANFKCKAPLHKQGDLLHLESSFVMGHRSRYWQTKWKVSDELIRKAVEKC